MVRRKTTTFKERLAAAIERDGRSLAAIAADAGTTPQHLSMLRNPEKINGQGVDGAVDLCRRFAKALGCTAEELLGL